VRTLYAYLSFLQQRDPQFVTMFCMNNKDIVPDCFYRISVKALILNDARDKFMIVRETNGKWELPGGGLDWGMTPQEDLPREIQEEMNLKVTSVAQDPSYFFTFPHDRTGTWCANIMYEATVENLDFTSSRECSEIMFIGPSELPEQYKIHHLK